ncbi:hypothetical protein [Rhodococcus sp. IEGM 1408]|uniref:hypothetical protein n=1 Tax=Rhodococcus sp. IEGM 1408 TaxID=3082220 RepID=UPI002952CE1D|nr:hypothetical protein [Rhodococcus sp. IEGM 1408]MDV8000509.1 hypothetical protein [Rhodococcus sp. IEGM 1408]
MPRTPRSTGFPVRLPNPWLPVLAPARGPTAVATYLRVHLYGAAVGRSVLDRCISAVGPDDRARLVPLRGEFEQEMETASLLLSQLTPIGTPGRRLLRLSSKLTLSVVPVGPVLSDPLARLGVLEALRTLVVAKRSMWELLADSWVADGPSGVDDDEVGGGNTGRVLTDLARQAAAQERLLEELRRTYGLAVFE